MFAAFSLTLRNAIADEIPLASVQFADPDTTATPDFQRHVVPLLGKLGCSSAKCHGSFQGQGDFRLSLFGFDFHQDHLEITDEDRINREAPHESLLLLKPTKQVKHKGGKRFEKDGWEYHLLRSWIEAGAKGIDTALPEPSEISNKGHEFFTESIQPLLENHCYECHGFDKRKGGLQLKSREAMIEGGDSGKPAIIPSHPDKSLLIEAIKHTNPDLEMPPRRKLEDEEIAKLEKWIRMGAPWPSATDRAPLESDKVLVTLHYEPSEILFRNANDTAQIKIIAEWEDGERENVSCLARFNTNNDTVATVDSEGAVSAVGEGDTHIVALYDNGVVAIPVLRPHEEVVASDSANLSNGSASMVDRFVSDKLSKLNIAPSPVCTDTEFLRRVSIDMTGTLPTPEEVTEFLADRSEDKRTGKIDELLKRPTYAAWWANKLCDFTGCNPASIKSLQEVAQEEGYVKASRWYDWIYEHVANNTPYDKLVEGIMLADPSGWTDEGMPYFWTRQSLEEPKDTAMSVAHSFLGIQLQCAECHKHPFDRWTQNDFVDFAAFFDPKRKSDELKLLRSETVALTEVDDPREPIMKWMSDPDNPWFAQAFVNRVWAGYFHAGIVDPPDQFTPANPPSNPQLLEWLTKGFIDSGYDMKWLHRRIANSATYQRSWKPNQSNRQDRRNFSRAIPRRIPAEVLYDALKQATAASDEFEAVRTNLKRRASGHLSMRMAGTHAMKVFGKPDRAINCDCERVNEPTLLQSIFLQNDPLVRMRLADSGWIAELEEEGEVDQRELIDQIWLRTVNRLPTEVDRTRAEAHLASVTNLTEGVTDLL
ncbi:PSD1 and planctomycete cytochrome C domain-containing protein, partial [Verrucomicrobiales bacterium]|nr:PSD1 and planctomycete cytochrome C domain-containing protein [Verrucomicrobiales bacterium]